jgi:hypothetical protein
VTTTTFTPEMTARLRELLTRFKLPTFGSEVVGRLTQAGHEAALPTLLEVFETEHEDRGHRRCERLLRASHLPPGKTFESSRTVDRVLAGIFRSSRLRSIMMRGREQQASPCANVV